ncbi:Hint domain-containing protein [Oceaniovalibus sp. ACAM 378]|uniref:Hint domain-containing protein n=1 Tax=Oceaniovalibus sp. ACAM 378 TaxID=2599923 RepID=UPI0011D30B99|nr:Hint domain-containing protein [Oceaniovalibus sp. ACAM 378]TYB88529.1 hypothetical protein FQ320_11100 [Oceaniovalibus sp. ACAM 378]
MADTLPTGLFISEILADNAGGSAHDTDSDGKANKADEYIEIQNGSGSAVSLDGLQVWSQAKGLLYTFDSNAAVAPGQTATLVGEYTGTPPAGFYSAGISNNGDFLPDGEGNKFDTLYLYDPGSNSFTSLSYGLPPRDATPPAGFPSGAVRSGSGESIDSGSPNGVAITRDANGNLTEGTPSPGTPGTLCIARGTMIATSQGPVAVENLRPGHALRVKDGRPQTLRAVGWTCLSQTLLASLPELAPVTLSAGLIGNTRPLTLSPNHRVMTTGALPQLLFGEPEVLTPAKSIAGALREAPQGPVTYFHLLLDSHALIRAEGAWIESLYLGDVGRDWVQNMRSLGHLHEQSCAATDLITHDRTVRPCLKLFEALLLAGPTANQPIRPSPTRAARLQHSGA